MIATREGQPILLDLIFDCNTATKAVANIKEVCISYGIDISKQVTALVGDNAPLNDVIATALGLPRLRCIPHTLHMVFKKIVKRFKRYLAVTRTLSSVLRACGGGTYRSEALQSAGLRSNRLRAVETRWDQLHAVVEY